MKKKSWLKIFLLSLFCFLFAILCFLICFFNKPYKSLILLQNSDELRATGGFLGSVAILQHQGFKIQDFQLIDIYDLDHQIASFPIPPPPVQKYLSGGLANLHLQDANWERDFPLSARQISSILTFFDKFDFIWAVNSTLFEKILTDLGGLHFKVDDQNIFINADNFSSLARKDHEIFNANRLPKTTFLNNFKNQLSNQIHDLTLPKKIELIDLLWRSRLDREWQVYSNNYWWQGIFKLLGVSGQLEQNSFCQKVYLIESNVGVNKSNRNTSTMIESVSDSNLGTNLNLEVTFDNSNFLDPTALVTQRLHYVNYQRLLLPVGVNLTQLSWNGSPIDDYDERFFIDSSGNNWHEIGFLIVINEQSRGKLVINLSGPLTCWKVLQ